MNEITGSDLQAPVRDFLSDQCEDFAVVIIHQHFLELKIVKIVTETMFGAEYDGDLDAGCEFFEDYFGLDKGSISFALLYFKNELLTSIAARAMGARGKRGPNL